MFYELAFVGIGVVIGIVSCAYTVNQKQAEWQSWRQEVFDRLIPLITDATMHSRIKELGPEQLEGWPPTMREVAESAHELVEWISARAFELDYARYRNEEGDEGTLDAAIEAVISGTGDGFLASYRDEFEQAKRRAW